MIGREGPVNHYDLLRWARRMASACDLKPIEAHVLLILATYADENAEAWPALKTIVLACGRTPGVDGKNSAVSRALVELQRRQLIWTTLGGRGRTAKRELLFDPAYPMRPAKGWEASFEPMPSPGPEGIAGLDSPDAFPDTGPMPSPIRDPEVPVEVPDLRAIKKNQESLPSYGKASHPSNGKASTASLDDERHRVRLAIVQSLAEAEPAA